MMSRWFPRIVLVVGGLASIATSQAPNNWSVVDRELIPAGVINPQTASIKYPIRAELQGPGPYQYLDGVVSVLVDIDPRTAPASMIEVRARMTSLTHPELPPEEQSVSFNDDGKHGIYVTFPAWTSCTVDPCIEDYQLEIIPGAIANPPIYDVTGTIDIDARDEGSMTPPQGTQITLTIGPAQ